MRPPLLLLLARWCKCELAGGATADVDMDEVYGIEDAADDSSAELELSGNAVEVPLSAEEL